MTTQITVRIPDDLVAFVDALVAAGAVTSRADAVARALARERRRQTALEDVAILRRVGGDADLDALAEHAAAHPLDLGD
ncbi:Antitoxin [Frankia canadensis]|uniref:Antitoxin n=1 Tax=Frankia canadensis TaxID=1836972 RepID=A0A2I2KLP6_9ACTN|nr:Antitoxin [Frankia canadensis]SOU53856.1 Antitoxin [Frankia canadensis]